MFVPSPQAAGHTGGCRPAIPEDEKPMIWKPLLLVASAALLLAACGGGGRALPPDREPPPGPVEVSVPGLDAIPAARLDMTDNVFAIVEPGRVAARDPEAEGSPVYRRERRDEVVCAGASCVFPAGADGGRNAHDGVRHARTRERDASIAFHGNILARGRALPAAGAAGGIPAFRVDVGDPAAPPSAEIRGGWGEWSAFYSAWERDALGALDLTWSAAFGAPHGARPTELQGGATWRGAMVGHTREGGVELQGRSRLDYDFAAGTLDLTLDGIAATARATARGQSYTGPGSFAWGELPVAAGGTFGLAGHGSARPGTDLHETLGQVDGAFYGPGAAEAAGVFERSGVTGAFGARRDGGG